MAKRKDRVETIEEIGPGLIMDAVQGLVGWIVVLIVYHWLFGAKGVWPNLFYNMIFN